ncbi:MULTISPECIES: AraC family transcriptional regulator [unclassified Oceanispirochaeta]|nr:MULTISPECIES: AraC family transcriptional regulator [unclassified Oceanispirochaeta]MBF9017229.1 helix-turn-helix transcriptional regulator [Oceanispirochaeta sp. M2]NPD73678.1 helix-turn-helix transcriptional regulator [Oceanispirochaeta sp. M1]
MTNNLFPCGSCPIENITGVWRFQRPALHNNKTSSLPGHLLHYIIDGSYTVRIGSKVYYPQKGNTLYYYGGEEVIWEGNDSEVDFYSVGFTGTGIPVLSPDERIINTAAGTNEKWDNLWDISNNVDLNNGALLSYSILLDILASIFWNNKKQIVQTNSKNWQSIENMIRSEGLYHIPVEQLSEKAGLSRSSIYSLCRNEVGSTPNQRLKDIRIEEAKGLLKYSEMRIGEISDYLGYKRIHDFSREFRKESGISGREYRQMVQNQCFNEH